MTSSISTWAATVAKLAHSSIPPSGQSNATGGSLIPAEYQQAFNALRGGGDIATLQTNKSIPTPVVSLAQQAAQEYPEFFTSSAPGSDAPDTSSPPESTPSPRLPDNDEGSLMNGD